jgi:hypothetical protein
VSATRDCLNGSGTLATACVSRSRLYSIAAFPGAPFAILVFSCVTQVIQRRVASVTNLVDANTMRVADGALLFLQKFHARTLADLRRFGLLSAANSFSTAAMNACAIASVSR